MIISISGLIGSGKDTIADYLCRFHGFKRMSFASSLKDAVASVFNWDRELLEGTTKSSREWREQRDDWWSNRLGMDITPRFILQNWGTEVCRNNFHRDIWVASVENKLRTTTDSIVITDSRFKNELIAIKSVGGITCRVIRGEDPDWCEWASRYNMLNDSSALKALVDAGIHPSEYSSVGLDYDFTIANDGSIDDLYRQVNNILQRHSFSK